MAEKKVLGNQYTTKNCFICGERNPAGLRMRFFNLEDGQVVGLFTPAPVHCSYPDRMHGGVITAVLDETIGRAILMVEPETFGVTGDISLRFKKPVPLGVELKAVGRLTANTRRLFEGEGEIYLPDGSVAVTAKARYMKIPLSSLGKDMEAEEEFFYDAHPEDPASVDLPER